MSRIAEKLEDEAMETVYPWIYRRKYEESHSTFYAQIYAENFVDGYVEGYLKTIMARIRGMMEEEGKSAEEAMELLDLPESDWEDYKALLNQ